MRQVKSAIVIVPRAGGGQHVFRPEARRIAALYEIPDERVIVFDERLPPARRFAFVCTEVERICSALPPGELIDSVIVLCHGWKTGDQIGATNANIAVLIASFVGRLSERCVWAFYSCSNGADTSVGPGGDGSFADRTRDELCAVGAVWCRTVGHLAPGHATRYPFARFFDGEGKRTGGAGGYGVIPSDSPLFPAWRAELRKAVDPDGAGPEPMTSLRWLFPWMERQEIEARLGATDQLCRDCGRSEPPSVLELQVALARGGYDPGPQDGVAGRRTTAAVRAFQRAHHLAVDGDPGPLTWAALRVMGLLDASPA